MFPMPADSLSPPHADRLAKESISFTDATQRKLREKV